jgi:anthranilate synthase component 1
MSDMYRPSRDEFTRLMDEFKPVPVLREIVGDFETPVASFKKIVKDDPAFLLESVEHGERWGRNSFIGLDPFLVMTSRDGKVSFEGAPPDVNLEAKTPLEQMRSVLEYFRPAEVGGLPPFHAGAVGYLGYDVVRYLENLPQTTLDDVGVPEMLLMFPRTILAFDHLKQKITLVSNGVPGDTYEEVVGRIERVVKQLAQPLSYQPANVRSAEIQLPQSTMTQEQYEKAVLRAQEYIAAGDIFQVVPSHRFSTTLEADPFDVYRVLRLINPSPYMFFLSHSEITVIGSSPEPLVQVQGRRIVQRPIAGTKPRGKTDEEDAAIEESFVNDEKERAEHVMLVDLARNDVGRVSEYGTVQVEELLVVEKYSHVMHLVSQVSGELREDCSAIDALFASFPAGTVSGAPKIRAME